MSGSTVRRLDSGEALPSPDVAEQVFGVAPRSAQWPVSSKARFARLRARFVEDAAFVSSLQDVVSLASFRDIVALGEDVVLHLYADMTTPDAPWLAWTQALREILGDGPVLRDDEAGVRQAVLVRWTEWLKNRAHPIG